MNNASKGRCVTVTPRGTRSPDFRFAILHQTAIGKSANWEFATRVEQTKRRRVLSVGLAEVAAVHSGGLSDHGD
jgi:hypothetical protein